MPLLCLREKTKGECARFAAVDGCNCVSLSRQLSEVLTASPGSFTSKRVSVVSKYIEILDTLPPRFRAAEVVYLSNNSISSLEGVAQFRDVRTLSLANNLVGEPEQLAVLASACPSLTTLSLEGNPIASHPRYRALVLQHLPWLRVLDGQVSPPWPQAYPCLFSRLPFVTGQVPHATAVFLPLCVLPAQAVTFAELSGTDLALRKHSHTMRMLFVNDCRIRQLQMLGRLLGVHRQLRRAVFGGVGRQVRGPPPLPKACESQPTPACNLLLALSWG